MIQLIKQIISHPISGSILVSLVTVAIVIWNTRTIKKNAVNNRLTKLEKEKVDIKDCKENQKKIITDEKDFRERIGKESNSHFKAINKIENALIFLVSKAGGNLRELGLTEN